MIHVLADEFILLCKCLICRDITKILSYRSYAISRQGIKRCLVLYLFHKKVAGDQAYSSGRKALTPGPY